MYLYIYIYVCVCKIKYIYIYIYVYFSLIIAIHGAYGNGEIRVKMATSDMSMVYMTGFPVAMLDFQRCSADPDIFTSSGRTW